MPPLPEEKDRKNFSLLSRVADDAMEDSFKLVCLWSHVMVGEMLGDSFFLTTFGMQSNSLSWLIRLGVPAAKYNLCNVYGDYLGGWVHYHLGHMLQADPPLALGMRPSQGAEARGQGVCATRRVGIVELPCLRVNEP